MISTMVSVSALQLITTQGSRTFATGRLVNSGANLRRRAPVAVTISNSSAGAEEEHPAQSEPPRLENFSQSRLSRAMRDKTILQKAESALYDKCMALEGDEAYRCWEALFEYENLKKEYETECHLAPSENRAEACKPLERFENMVRQSGGAASLVDNVRMVAKVTKKKADEQKAKTETSSETSSETSAHPHDTRTPEQIQAEQHERWEDGGIPKTLEELEHENDGMMPESPYTRVLRRRGRSAPWFTHPPNHETD